MIFQEPMLALDPVYTIGAQIAETWSATSASSSRRAKQRALQMLEHVRSRRRSAGTTPIRTRCPAACASAR